MATSASSESLITLQDSCSSINHKEAESAPKFQKFQLWSTGRLWTKWQFRSIGSRSILLILIWQVLISCSLGFTFETMQSWINKGSNTEEGEPSLWVLQKKSIVGILVLCCIIFPISSLLAEVAIGRYKLISYSMKLMWLLYIVVAVIALCEESLPMKRKVLHLFHCFLIIPQYLILGIFLASAVPLGIDQIVGGTNTNISSFIQWLTWAFYSGFAIPNIVGSVFCYCTHFKEKHIHMIMLLLPVLLLSVGLILDFCFHRKVVKEPVTVNPVSLIFKVLKYAARHKYPVQRSAFTYCENEQPTRLDYGKSKYGGPFTTEQVEDVKTFWRILLVLLVISMSAIPLIALGESAPFSFGSLQHETDCIHQLLHNILRPSSIMMCTIPLYELLIYPCLRNRGPNILLSAGIGAAALIVTSLYGITTETTSNILSQYSTTGCMFTNNSQNPGDTEILVGIPFKLILAFTNTVLPKSSIEFVCAQAPYNVKGFLIGLFFTLITFFLAIGTLVYFTWSSKWFPILGTSTCGIWFYLTTLVLAVVSSALLGLVIRWYKARERDEIPKNFVEEVYHKYQKQAD